MKTIFLILMVCFGDSNDCEVSRPATWQGSDVEQELDRCKVYGQEHFNGKDLY